MRARGETVWVTVGAVAGGLLVGPFHLQPAWLWGMFGGVTGGLAGALAAWVMARAWPAPVRVGVVLVLVLGVGFALWWIAGGMWITDPANLRIQPP